MIELVRPKCFVPVHGTVQHLTRHGELARETGVEQVCVIENGRVAELTSEGVSLGASVHAGRVHVFAGRAIPKEILRERQVLAEEGFASCALVIDGRGDAAQVSLVTRGVVDELQHPEEVAAACAAVRLAIAALDGAADDARLAEQARLAVRRAFFKSRGKKPMTVVHVTRTP